MGSVADAATAVMCCLMRWCSCSLRRSASEPSRFSYPPPAVGSSRVRSGSSRQLRHGTSAICRECRTAECTDSGFTFAEFLIALALVLLLSAVAARTVLEAGRAAIRAKDEAEWIATVTLFDRTLRTAFSAWPPAFWGREPDIEKSAAGYRIIDRSEATEFAVEISIDRAGTGKLAVLWAGRCTVIGPVDSILVAPCKRSGIDACTVIVLLVAGPHEQQFVVTCGGARL